MGKSHIKGRIDEEFDGEVIWTDSFRPEYYIIYHHHRSQKYTLYCGEEVIYFGDDLSRTKGRVPLDFLGRAALGPI